MHSLCEEERHHHRQALYDDKVLITFNYKEGTQTVTFGEATEAASRGNGSDFFVFFGKQNESLASIEKRPRPYHKKARQTTVRVP